MVNPYLKDKGSAVRFCLWPQNEKILKKFQSYFLFFKNLKKTNYQNEQDLY